MIIKSQDEYKRLLSVPEAQRYSGLGRRKLFYFVEKGLLPYLDISSGKTLPRFRFRRAALDQLISKLERNGGQ